MVVAARNQAREHQAVIAMNFKMYFDHAQTLKWCETAREITLGSDAIREGHARLVVFPSFPSIPDVIEIFSGSGVSVGAQNMSNFASGPFTGEVSAASLKQVGCNYIEIGHAERRNLFGETEDQIQEKVRLATENGLTPLLCVGEVEPTTPEEAARQCLKFITQAVASLDEETRVPVVIAYEPQWAIGAEKAADMSHIRAVSMHIRSWLAAHKQLANSTVIYGGSAGPGLYTELDGAVSGLFLGRRAHDPLVLESVLEETIA